MSKSGSLYVSDLDGTLLDARGELSPRTKAGLIRLLERGVLFTVASARSHFSIGKIFGEVPLALPVIEFNGAFLTDFVTGRHLETNSIPTPLAFDLFDRIRAAGQRPFVSSFNGSEDCLHFDELSNAGMVWYEDRRRQAEDPRLRRTAALRETMREQVVSLIVMDRSERAIETLAEQLASAYGSALQLYCYENEYSPGTFWLTIHDVKASKHIAMRSLRDRFASGCEIVALGDNVNDIEMLRDADRAIAVENAVPSVLQIADQVIPHHAKNSVIEFIEADVDRLGM